MSIGRKAGILCAGGALLLGGCHKQPEGQVVATVNGKEITQQELEAEAQAAQVPPNADKKTLFPILLQRVIARKLLDQAAEKKGVDKNPDYLVQKRRADETLLAQTYARQQLQAQSVPTASDITNYINGNPTLFANRARYTLDQIRFANPGDMSKLAGLKNAHTLAAVAAFLTQQGIKFERGTGTLDSGSVAPAVMQKILALPSGEPIVVPEGPLITVSVITGKAPVTVPADQQRVIATNLVRQLNSEKLIQQQLDALKASAKIQYAKGMEPPAQPGLVGGTPATQPSGQ